LNLVEEFVPETVYRVARHYCKNRQTLPLIYIKVSFLPLMELPLMEIQFNMHTDAMS